MKCLDGYKFNTYNIVFFQTPERDKERVPLFFYLNGMTFEGRKRKLFDKFRI